MLDPSGLLSTAGTQDHARVPQQLRAGESLTASSDSPKLLELLCPTGNTPGAEQLLRGCSPVHGLALRGQRDSRLGEPSQRVSPKPCQPWGWAETVCLQHYWSCTRTKFILRMLRDILRILRVNCTWQMFATLLNVLLGGVQMLSWWGCK